MMQDFTMMFNNFITKVPEYFEMFIFVFFQRQVGKFKKILLQASAFV